MGDRTYVTLTILKADYEKAKLLDPEVEDSENFDEYEVNNGIKLVDLGYTEVNYGELDFESDLQEAKIPYDKLWDAGCDYSAGVDYYRINTAGIGNLKSFGCDEEASNAAWLEKLIAAREGGIVALDALIISTKEDQFVMSWDEQNNIKKGEEHEVV